MDKKIFTTRIDNKTGEKIYRFDTIVNCNVLPNRDPVTVNNEASTTPADEPTSDEDVSSLDSNFEEWTTEYKNSLPDSSFAVVEKGYEAGKSPKTARHLPYKDKDGKIDLPHLKNAWDRRDQIESVLHTESNEELRARAEKVLEPLYKKYITKGKEPDKGEDDKETKSKKKKDDNAQDHRIDSSNTEVSTGPVRQTWRLISAVQAWPMSDFWQPQLVDYGHEGGKVLQGIIPLVNKGKPDLLWNHSHDAHDVAGRVENANWDASSDIPPGVNAELVVDPEFDAKAAMGLAKGFIRSGSIGITMDAKPSHENMKFEQFVENQGETIDGRQVRWLPVKVHAVRHMALLPTGTGADPNAGRRVQPDNSANIENQKNNDNPPTGESTQKGDMNMEKTVTLLASLAERLGIQVALAENSDLPEGLEERLNNKIDSLKSLREQYNTMAVKYEAIFAKMGCELSEDIMSAIDKTLILAEQGTKLLDHARKDALKWFDSSRAALGKNELSDVDKRLRSRLENSQDLSFIEESTEEYKSITEANLSSKRVSQGSDVTPEPSEEINHYDADIKASASRVFASIKKAQGGDK